LNDDKLELVKIHKDDIAVCEYDYIQSLPDETLIYKKSNIFLGLLEDIYQNVVSKYLLDKKTFFNDYNMLNEIFYKLYLPLVYKYGYTPSLFMYCSFVHISDSNITDILSGTYRKDGSRVNDETQRTVRKWYQTCKAATVTRAIDGNSIGAIFAAKAAYQMSDQPQPVAIETRPDPDQVDISAITEKYRNSPPPKFEPIE